MSDNEENPEDEKPFYVDRAKQGRATCKNCKSKLEKGELRLAKLAPNMFGAGKMKMWYHPACLFEVFMKQRPTTKRLESIDEIDNWHSLDVNDQNDILNRFEQFESEYAEKTGTKITPKKKTPVKDNTFNADKGSTSKAVKKLNISVLSQNSVDSDKSNESNDSLKYHRDNLFREFRRLCADISNVSSYIEKASLVRELFENGRDGKGFKGNIEQWCRLLLPGVIKRIYNLQSRQLIKLFSRILDTDFDDMLVDLEEGDVAETITKFFEQSTKIQPASKSRLTMDEVDIFLEELSKMTKEDEQINHLNKMTKRCTGNDLKIIIRLIKHDLRMNAGCKNILAGVHSDAYKMFQSSRDLKAVLSKVIGNSESIKTPDVAQKVLKAKISLMVPVLPMLAEPCKSIEMAMKKCPNGMYSEIKYDGERVQVHKRGSEFKYFSRSLKPVVEHKVNHFKEFIPQAFPHGRDLILDSEILMIDTITGKPLPFGTLGIHKKSETKNANVCLFVFDCIYYNGEILTDKSIVERRRILHENMTQIENHIMFSEMKTIGDPKDLASMIIDTFKLNLEGLVLKDLCSTYEPGKRHWLKVKKDYLFEGAMADSADLVVLGAWYGTGKKGGMMSVFLMGCYDPAKNVWCTVTKVHTGHDDATLENLQTELDMIKISCDPSKVPNWLKVTKTMIPDFVARDPKKQPVWEITGAEFTQHIVHTADGISVRFPRVTRIRSDKEWSTATSLPELRDLIKKSKEQIDDTLVKNLEEYVKNGCGVCVTDVQNTDKSPTEKENILKKNKIEQAKAQTSLYDVLPGLKRPIKNDFSNKTFKKFKKEPNPDEINEGSSREAEQMKQKSHYGDIVIKQERDTEIIQEHDIKIQQERDIKIQQERDIKIKQERDTKIKQECDTKMKQERDTKVAQECNIKVKQEFITEIKQEFPTKIKQEFPTKIKQEFPTKVKQEITTTETKNKKCEVSLSSEQCKHDKSLNSSQLSNEGCPSKKKKKNKKRKKIIKSNFPDVFLGIKLLMLPNVKGMNNELIRHFIAYGGVIVTEDQLEEATHIVHGTASVPAEDMLKYKPTVRHVTRNWLRDSISSKKLQEVHAYPVFLEGNRCN